MKKILLIVMLVVMSVTVMASSFEKAVDFTFGYEGAELDTTSSHSRYGVSKDTIKRYNKKYGTGYTVKSLTKSQAKKIAKKLYWNAYNLDTIESDLVGVAVFDFMYNSNPSNAAKKIEKAAKSLGANIKVDGTLTIAEMTSMNKLDSVELTNKICSNRLSYMQGLKVWKKYKKGWTKRVNAIKLL